MLRPVFLPFCHSVGDPLFFVLIAAICCPRCHTRAVGDELVTRAPVLPALSTARLRSLWCSGMNRNWLLGVGVGHYDHHFLFFLGPAVLSFIKPLDGLCVLICRPRASFLKNFISLF